MSGHTPENDAPRFKAFRDKRLRNPAIREAYEQIKAERDAEAIRPIADGERVWIAGEPVWVQYDPDLTVDGTPRYGCQTSEPTGFTEVEVKPYGALPEVMHTKAGMRKVIKLRRWDERVFLHEVLHVLLSKHYPPCHHGYASFIEDPKHEAAVREIEDGLWDMGWRLFDGETHVDPTRGPRLPEQTRVIPPGVPTDAPR